MEGLGVDAEEEVGGVLRYPPVGQGVDHMGGLILVLRGEEVCGVLGDPPVGHTGHRPCGWVASYWS